MCGERCGVVKQAGSIEMMISAGQGSRNNKCQGQCIFDVIMRANQTVLGPGLAESEGRGQGAAGQSIKGGVATERPRKNDGAICKTPQRSKNARYNLKMCVQMH